MKIELLRQSTPNGRAKIYGISQGMVYAKLYEWINDDGMVDYEIIMESPPKSSTHLYCGPPIDPQDAILLSVKIMFRTVRECMDNAYELKEQAENWDGKVETIA